MINTAADGINAGAGIRDQSPFVKLFEATLELVSTQPASGVKARRLHNVEIRVVEAGFPRDRGELR